MLSISTGSRSSGTRPAGISHCGRRDGGRYRLALQGAEPDWKLEMTPIEEEVARYVERIVVSGRAGRIGQIEVREASGDRSVMTVN